MTAALDAEAAEDEVRAFLALRDSDALSTAKGPEIDLLLLGIKERSGVPLSWDESATLAHGALRARRGQHPYDNWHRNVYICMAVALVIDRGFRPTSNRTSRNTYGRGRSACSIVAGVFGLTEDAVYKIYKPHRNKSGVLDTARAIQSRSQETITSPPIRRPIRLP